MLKIALSGTQNDVLKASYVLSLVFQGVTEGTKSGDLEAMQLVLQADDLPGNQVMLSLLQPSLVENIDEGLPTRLLEELA